MAKTSGKELNDFYENGFPKGFFHDYGEDVEELMCGSAERPFIEDRMYDTEDLGHIVTEDETKSYTFSHFFRKWKKTQDKATVLVEVPVNAVNEAKAKIKALGYKVL